MSSTVTDAPSVCLLPHRKLILSAGVFEDCPQCGRRPVGPKPTVHEFWLFRSMLGLR